MKQKTWDLDTEGTGLDSLVASLSKLFTLELVLSPEFPHLYHEDNCCFLKLLRSKEETKVEMPSLVVGTKEAISKC